MAIDERPSTPVIREMRVDDIPDVFRIRTSVTENFLSIAQLEELYITPASIASALSRDTKGWVAEESGRVVAFIIADITSVSIFALFVLSPYEGKGLGSRLLQKAVAWLQLEERGPTIWLTTTSGTRALRFYQRHGWIVAGVEPDGSLRLELHRALGELDSAPSPASG